MESFEVDYEYPFDYGFIVGTNRNQENCIDCYVLSGDKIKEGEMIECKPIVMIEVYEDNEIDHKVIMKAAGYEDYDINETIQTIKVFIINVFKRFADTTVRFGEIIDKEATVEYIIGNSV